MPHPDQRLSIDEVDPAATDAVRALERYVRAGDLEATLLDLLKIRASQLNGCAFCLDMHHREARAHGEAQRRLDVLAGWHEVPSMFGARERAALALTEAVTRIGDAGVSDLVWDEARGQFSEAELVRLLLAIAAINVWNRLAVTTRQQPPPDEGGQQ
jgi:AhpD family alkylhydroperoxidase